MNRLLIYAYYAKVESFLHEYVTYALKAVKPMFKKIVFISNRELNTHEKKEVLEICNEVIVDTNCKSNFALWKRALEKLNFKVIEEFDFMAFMDNSCFGPLFDIEKVLTEVEEKQINFFGAFARDKVIKKNGTVNYIPESSFMHFDKKVIKSEKFKKFLEEKFCINKSIKSKKHETKLAKMLLRDNNTCAAYSFSSYFITGDVPKTFEKLFFEEGPIFIRIKDILYKYINPLELYGLFNTFKNYDKKLIEEYVSECYPPNTSILLCDKTFLCFISKLYSKKENAIKVAMHLHVFYIDIFKEYLKTFKKIDTKIDLFITTDSEDKKIEIANLLKIFEVDSWVKEIIVYENRGRDVLPWIKISSKMTNYDLVGHFHTKKSKHKKNATVKIWNKEIFSSLLETLPVVLELFANNKKIGILIPDIPINFCSEDKNIGWGDNKKLCISLYERMLTKKRIDLSKVKDPIMPYGNMFWYRPEALQPIFDLNLKDEVFPDEPLPFDGTIAHALERLPVYVAWSEGYDFRISLSEKQIESRFLTKFKKLNSLSITINFDRIFWRIARAIKLPKGLKKVFKKTLFYLLRKN